MKYLPYTIVVFVFFTLNIFPRTYTFNCYPNRNTIMIPDSFSPAAPVKLPPDSYDVTVPFIKAQSFTAKHYKNIVDSVAEKIDSTAKLLSVISDSAALNGTSKSWIYEYRGTQENTAVNYFFHTTLNSATYDSLNKLIEIGTAYISKPWIDSDSALTVAEAQGGKEFRNRNPDYKIKMELIEPLTPSLNPRWFVYYISLDNPDSVLFVNINAVSIISSVRDLNKTQPEKFILYQNYPNPFNPTTIINYRLSNSGYVTLKIYDVLGRLVKTLVEGNKLQGGYSVRFNGNNMASGVYFYQLEVTASNNKDNTFVAVKKMLLIK